MPFPDYNALTETLNGTVEPSRLDRQIRAAGMSAGAIANFQGISTSGDTIHTMFAAVPPGADQAIVTATVAAHDGTVVHESGLSMLSFAHDADHTITGVLTVPAWSLIENEDPNVKFLLYPNGATNEVLCFEAGLYRIRYGCTVIISKDHEIVRGGVYNQGEIIDGLDAEVVLRNTGTDRAGLSGDHAVRLDAGASISPYFYTASGDNATIIAHTPSWSIQYITSRGQE